MCDRRIGRDREDLRQTESGVYIPGFSAVPRAGGVPRVDIHQAFGQGEEDELSRPEQD